MGPTSVCASCWKILARSFEEQAGQRRFAFGPCRFGMIWSPGGAPGHADLIHALKGSGGRGTWPELAWLWMQRHRETVSGQRWLLIPMPSSRRHSGEDHALQFARALAPWVGGHVLRPFLPAGGGVGPQKQKSRSGREKLVIGTRSKAFGNWLEGRVAGGGWRVALVDDVVTTGSTLNAGHQALGAPAGVEAWTLAFRSLTNNLARRAGLQL